MEFLIGYHLLVILDYDLLKTEEQWYNTYRLANRKSHAELTDLFEISYLELSKFKSQGNIDHLGNREKWALFLSTESEEVLDMLKMQSQELEKAVEKLVYVSADEKLRFEYEMREKAERDYYSDMAGAEKRGLNKGIEQGLKQGLALGQREEQVYTVPYKEDTIKRREP